jgi:hypothetical protein
MYIGSLPAASNRATYTQDFQLYDDDNDEGVSLAAATIVLEVRKPGTTTALLHAMNGSGITVTDEDGGGFTLRFTVDEMRALCAGTYECGITVEQSGDTTQFFIGTLPVLDGIVS